MKSLACSHRANGGHRENKAAEKSWRVQGHFLWLVGAERTAIAPAERKLSRLNAAPGVSDCWSIGLLATSVPGAYSLHRATS